MKALIFCFLCACLGALGIITLIEVEKNRVYEAKITKLEADVRTYAGKYLDLQEANDDARDALEVKASVAAYELEVCQKRLKP